MNASGFLARSGLVVVTGKGGVGKTTLSAALGRLFAARGRRTMLIEIDPRQNLHHVLGVPPTDGDVVAAGDRLWLQNLRPTAVLEELVRAKLKVPALARRVTASPIFQHFAAGAPGFKELALLGHALRLLRGDLTPRVDVVVLDAPATGHGAALLAAPQLVAEVIGSGPVGALAREVADFVTDARRCGVVIVMHAEPMAQRESLELIGELERRVGRPPEVVIANAVFPPLPAGPAPRGAGEAAALWRARRADSERSLAALRRDWRGELVELPLLGLEGAPLVAALMARLEAA
jgi:anion-transporting  ArsA/GET3 family ATPase